MFPLSAPQPSVPPPPVVLVVDDEPSICRALAIFLGRSGYEVLVAVSSEEAERVLRVRRVDALVVDLRIPDARGDVLFHWATSLQPHLAHATVFISGDVTARASELVAACRCPLVSKPFDLDQIRAALDALLRGRRSARA